MMSGIIGSCSSRCQRLDPGRTVLTTDHRGVDDQVRVIFGDSKEKISDAGTHSRLLVIQVREELRYDGLPRIGRRARQQLIVALLVVHSSKHVLCVLGQKFEQAQRGRHRRLRVKFLIRIRVDRLENQIKSKIYKKKIRKLIKIEPLYNELPIKRKIYFNVSFFRSQIFPI